MDAPETRNTKHRTACDRCYRLKERCDRTTTSSSCARCQRLRVSCSTIRPVRPAGRRATYHQKSFVSTTPRIQCEAPRPNQQAIDLKLNIIPIQQPGEKELLLFLLDQPGSLDYYVVCPSFQAEQQQMLAAQLSTSPSFLKDALLACAITIKQLQASNVSDVDSGLSLTYISKAMDALRSLPVLSPHDAILCHALGCMLAFSIYAAIGVGVPDICQYCLNATGPFLGQTVSGTYKDPWQSLLALLEITNCLMYRQTPTLRIRIPSSVVVDCHMGLCLPLLPYYHDLCVISNTLTNANDIGFISGLDKQLNDIHSAVELWRPVHLDQLVGRFDSAEIVHLLAQAKLYRLGALLLVHRLRYPFGQEDTQAELWSKEVMMELDMAKQVTKRPLRFVTLPFIVAAVEIRDETLRSKALQHVDDWVDHFAPFMQKATKTFLSRIWLERDLNLTGRWFDSIHKPCPVLDSITSTCFLSS